MATELTGTTALTPVTIPITGMSSVTYAREAGKSHAVSIGFPPATGDEISLVVSELASNLVKHANGGTIRITTIESAERKGIQIESEDNGPGIVDIERALTDGFSTAGSLGTGLGTVNRLMDDIEFHPRTPHGMLIVCHRWQRPPSSAVFASPLQFGAATRGYRGQSENGDAFIIRQWENHALAGVIDGLGHGQFAQRASSTARQYVEAHFDQPLNNLFRGVGRVCRPTRGVVMALIQFDLVRKVFAVASVGNVEVRFIGDRPLHLIVRRGVIGLNAPQPVISEHEWVPANILIIHSDGLKTHWDWKDYRDLAHEPASVIAQRLLSTLGKWEDDVTVVVVKDTRA